MIKLICVGKIKENYLNELIDDYKNRINKYHKLQIIELKDNPVYKKEIESILNNINDKEYNIALDIKGNKLNSIEFAKKVNDLFQINSNITFIIGGSVGLNEEVLKKCNDIISFSDLTFPHGLFRGIFLEQLYRSFKINNNESYHK